MLKLTKSTEQRNMSLPMQCQPIASYKMGSTVTHKDVKAFSSFLKSIPKPVVRNRYAPYVAIVDTASPNTTIACVPAVERLQHGWLMGWVVHQLCPKAKIQFIPFGQNPGAALKKANSIQSDLVLCAWASKGKGLHAAYPYSNGRLIAVNPAERLAYPAAFSGVCRVEQAGVCGQRRYFQMLGRSVGGLSVASAVVVGLAANHITQSVCLVDAISLVQPLLFNLGIVVQQN